MSNSMFVLQPWVANAPYKCQSILLSGLRNPDVQTRFVKMVTRWMRSVCQYNADPSTDYMQAWIEGPPGKEEVEAELEYLTCHYVHHFADALRVVAIWHPNTETAAYARELHNYIAEETFHFIPEDDETFVRRHKDKV